MSVGVEINP